jgi:hypothetical protein
VDLTRQVGYRGFAVNTVTQDAEGRNYGCELIRVGWNGPQGVGYSEKRALMDGRDASDVYLDRRILSLQGALYGVDRPHLWDLWQDLVSAFTPTAAYDDEPGDRGFMPLDYWVPTRNTESFPTGFIHKMLNVRPISQPSTDFVSDAHGGADHEAMSLRWEVLVEAKDPRVYAFLPTIIDIEGLTDGSGNLVNLGDYPSPLNVLLVVAPLAAPASFTFEGAGSNFSISMPTSVFEQVFRYSAKEKVLSLEKNGVETLKMDLLDFTANTTHPLVQRGSTPYEWSTGGAPVFEEGSRIWHWDSWA